MMLTLLLGLAFAEETTDARAKELYENGADLYAEGRYEDAYVAWEEAYRLSQKPLLLYNMANAMERGGDYRKALDLFNQYRAYATGDERELLNRKVANLTERILQSGEALPPLTQPTASPDPTPTPTVTTPSTTSPTTASSTTATDAAKTRNGPPTATYVLGGVGAAGLASGAYFGITAISARGQAEGYCVTAGEALRCPGEAQAFIERDALHSLIADISLGVGGASLLTAIIVAFVDEPPPVMPLLTPAGGGLSLQGQF